MVYAGFAQTFLQTIPWESIDLESRDRPHPIVTLIVWTLKLQAIEITVIAAVPILTLELSYRVPQCVMISWIPILFF